jgi:hypothetical protein
MKHYHGIVNIPNEIQAKLMDFVQEICSDLKIRRKMQSLLADKSGLCYDV